MSLRRKRVRARARACHPGGGVGIRVPLERRQLLASTAVTGAALGAFLAGLALGFVPAAEANPLGGTVVGGSATITQQGATETITQATNRAAVNWQSFSVGAKEATVFVDPSPASVTLNRVVGPDPSAIAGSLRSNGMVILVNPSGVAFSNGAQVNVNSLIATTANISNANFMAGKLIFDSPSPNPNASVTNAGTITIADQGLAALVAPSVTNSGIITARLGRVALAGAETFTLDMFGDGLISFDVTSTVNQAPLGPDGKPVPALVSNSGLIEANGGQVLLTAAAAKGIVDNVIDMSGQIVAQSVSAHNGMVVFSGGAGPVTVAGSVDVSGTGAGETGGSVQVLGQQVTLAGSASINAAGDAGGGTVLIGGNFHGAGPQPNATTTVVAAGAAISADAIASGNGGQVAIWADGNTTFAGSITARGGASGGNGGSVEVSGLGHLDFSGSVNLLASKGMTGTLLLDPADVTISAAPDSNETFTNNAYVPTSGASASNISASELAANLATANVTIVTTNSGSSGSGAGTIAVTAPVSWTSGTTLTLSAASSITVAANLTSAASASPSAGTSGAATNVGPTLVMHGGGGASGTGTTTVATATGGTSTGTTTGAGSTATASGGSQPSAPVGRPATAASTQSTGGNAAPSNTTGAPAGTTTAAASTAPSTTSGATPTTATAATAGTAPILVAAKLTSGSGPGSWSHAGGSTTSIAGRSTTFAGGPHAAASGGVTLDGNGITVNAPIKAGTVTLDSTGTVTDTSKLTATTLTGTSSGGASLSGPNAVTTLASFDNATGGSLSITNAKSLATTGTVSSAGSLALTTTKGDLNLGGTLSGTGSVALSAAGNVAVTGTVASHNADGSGGTIAITGGATSGTLTVSGTVDASSSSVSGAGGLVTLTAANVNLTSTAVVAANGGSNGGTILIGGDVRGGQNPALNLSPTPIANAETVTVAAGATILANGGAFGGSGNGGSVVVWSNGTTTFDGAISVRGGAQGGDGGYAETSGESTLIVGPSASVNAAAPKGKGGQWLLDPDSNVDITTGTTTSESTNTAGGTETFTPMADASVVANTDIITALSVNDTSVVITTNCPTGCTGASTGTITVDAAILAPVTTNLSLTLDAGAGGGNGGITINQQISDAGSVGGALSLNLNTSGGAIAFDGPSSIVPAASIGGSLMTTGGAVSQTAPLTVGGTSSFNAGANTITLNNSLNAFTKAVSLTTTGTSNNASITNATALTLGASTVTGSLTATVATTGNLTVSGALAAGGGGVALTAGTGSNIDLNAKVTTTSGTVTFNNPVELSATTAVDTTNGGAATGAGITFTSTIDSLPANFGLTLTAGAGAISIGGAVGSGAIVGTGPLGAFSASSTAASGTTLDGNVTAAGVTVTGETTLGNASGTTLTIDTTKADTGAAADGAIMLAGVDGTAASKGKQGLTLTAGSAAITLGTVGATTPIGALSSSSTATSGTTLNGNVTAAGVTVTGETTLGNASGTTLTIDTTKADTGAAADGAIMLAGVDGTAAAKGKQGLTLTAGSAAITLGTVGGTTPIGALSSSSTAASGTTLDGNVTAAGVTVTGETTLGNASGTTLTIDTTKADTGAAADGAIMLAGVDGTAASKGKQGLTLTAGSAAITLGTVGGTTPIGALSSSSTATSGTTLDGNVTAAGVMVTGETTLGNASGTTLTIDTTKADTGAAADGAIMLAGVDGTAASKGKQGLTLTAGSAAITLGTVGGTTPIGALSSSSTATSGTTLDGNVTAAGVTVTGETTLGNASGTTLTIDTKSADTGAAADGAIMLAAVDGTAASKGKQGLTLTAGSAAITLGTVGGTTPIGALSSSSTAASGTTLDGNVTAAGVTVTGETTLGNASGTTLTIDTTKADTGAAADGAIMLAGVDGTAASKGKQGLTLTAATATVALGTVGGTTPIGALSSSSTATSGTTLDGNVTAAGVTVTGETTLGNASGTTLTIDTKSADTGAAADGAIMLAGVDGTAASKGKQGLTLTAATATVALGTVGGTTPIGALSSSSTAASGTTLDGNVTAAGVTVTGETTLGNASGTTLTIDTKSADTGAAADGAIMLAGVDGTAAAKGKQGLTLTAATATIALGTVGATTPIGALSSSSTATSGTTLNGNVTAAGVTVTGETTLGNASGTTLTIDTKSADTGAAADGAIMLAGVDGTAAGKQGLMLESGTATIALQGNVGSVTALGALTMTDATLDISPNVNITTAGGAVSETGATVLLGAVATTTVIDTTNSGGTATGAGITFTSTINGTTAGDQSLTLEGGTLGAIDLGGNIGTTALGHLIMAGTSLTFEPAVTTVAANSEITLRARGATLSVPVTLTTAAGTVWLQSDTGDVKETGAGAITTANLLARATNGSVMLASTSNDVTGDVAGVATGTGGTFTFDDTVGFTVLGVGASGGTPLSTHAVAAITNPAITAGSGGVTLTVTPSATIDLNADITTAAGPVTINNPVVLSEAPLVTVDTTNGGAPATATGAAITFASTIDDMTMAGQQGLTLEGGSAGTITLDGNIGATAVTSPLGTLTVEGSAIIFGGAVAAIDTANADQTFRVKAAATNLSISPALSAGTGTVRLQADNGNVTQTAAGNILAGGLLARAGTLDTGATTHSVTLTNAGNGIGSTGTPGLLAGSATGDFNFQDGGTSGFQVVLAKTIMSSGNAPDSSPVITAVNGVTAETNDMSALGAIRLQTQSGSILQDPTGAGANLTAAKLLVIAGVADTGSTMSTVTLTNKGNTIEAAATGLGAGLVAGSATGDFNFQDGGSLDMPGFELALKGTIGNGGAITAVSGITAETKDMSALGTIRLATQSGDITQDTTAPGANLTGKALLAEAGLADSGAAAKSMVTLTNTGNAIEAAATGVGAGLIAGSATGDFNFQDGGASGFTVGTVTADPLTGLIPKAMGITAETNGAMPALGMIRLQTPGGNITEATGASLVSGGLLARASAGMVTLTSTTNAVSSNVAGVSAGTFSFVDSVGFAVNTVAADPLTGLIAMATGITTTNADLTLKALGGDMLLKQNLAAGSGTVRLDAVAGNVTQSGGGITATNLLVEAGAAVTLPDTTNTVSGMLAGTSGASFSFVNSTGITVGSVTTDALGLVPAATGITGGGDVTLKALAGSVSVNQIIADSAGTTRLDAVGGDVTESGTGAILALNLLAEAGGMVKLLSTADAVGGIIAGMAAGGPFSFVDSVGFTVGTIASDALGLVPGASGVMAANADVTLLSLSGNTVLAQNLSAGSGTVRLQEQGGSLTETTGAVMAANLLVLAGGQVTLANPGNAVGGNVAGMSSGGSFAFVDSLGFTVGSVGGDALGVIAGASGITAVNADATLQALNGNIVLGQNVSAGSGTVRLQTLAGNLTETGGNITGSNLLARASGQVTLANMTNAVGGKLAGVSGGSFSFVDALGFTVDSVGADALGLIAAASGVTTTNADITLKALGGGLALNQPLAAGSGTVRLQAVVGDLTQSAGGGITAANLLADAGGSVVLCNGEACNLAQSNTTNLITGNVAGTAGGTFSFADDPALTIGPVSADALNLIAGSGSSFISAGGNVFVSALGDVTVSPQSGTPILMTNADTHDNVVLLRAGGDITMAGSAAFNAGLLVLDTTFGTFLPTDPLLAMSVGGGSAFTAIMPGTGKGDVLLGSIQAPGSVLLLVLGAGMASNSGTLELGGLDILRSGGSSSLTGSIKGVSGSFAATLGLINDTPDNSHIFNTCAVASVTCFVLPPLTPFVPEIVNNVEFLVEHPTFDDPDVDIINISNEDLLCPAGSKDCQQQ